MTDHDRDLQALDRVIEEIRSDRLDDAAVAAATQRVWQRLAGELEPGLASCRDYQRLIPELAAGSLPPARALLVEDHTRQCLACRRSLLAARGRTPLVAPVVPIAPARRALPAWLRLAAAAVLGLGVATAALAVAANLLADRRLAAIVDAGSGLQRIEAARATELPPGAVVRSRELLRTGRDLPAQLRLADGSLLEIAPRSELDLRGGLGGTTIRLGRGNIIVHAADQGRRRLRVDTADCQVAVRGTVFAVDHGLKGSRVSVLEGQVEVRQGGRLELLAPGEQVTTSDRLQPVSIEDQVAWSAHAEEHAALLRELSQLRRELADAIEPSDPRTSSRLLDLVPDDTVIYVALPNLAEGLGEARAVLEQRLAASPLLRQWWQERVVATGIDRQVDAILDRLQPLGEAVGDEVVVALTERGFRPGAGPVVIARLDDPRAFTALLEEQAATAGAAAGAPVLALVDDPGALPPATAELVVWIDGDLAIAAAHVEQLQSVAHRTGAPGQGGFADSELRAELAEAYRRGVSWLLGVDLGRIMDAVEVPAGGPETVLLDRLGISDARTFVVGSRRDGARRSLDAALSFAGPRHGLAGWLAEPSPMGSLDFISPDASFAAAAVSEDAVVMFDDLLAAVAAVEPDAIAELGAFEHQIGIDLRTDFALPLGGEAAFAVDGPLLPFPAWKLIVEVYDPDTLLATLERAVAEVNLQLAADGQPGIELGESVVSGRTYRLLRHPAATAELALLVVDGYLVVAPGVALIEQALVSRSAGVTLPASAAFRELLPSDGHADCSAIVWRNFGGLLASIPDDAIAQLPAEAQALLDEGAGPGLLCAYGTDDGILASGSGNGLLSGVPLFGLTGRLAGRTAASGRAQERLSSPG